MPEASRRAFLRGRNPSLSTSAIRPPWSLPGGEFTHLCERCNTCIDSCPEYILLRGDGGFPEVDFERGECTFCGKCAEACEADAFNQGAHTPDNAWKLDVEVKSSCLSMNSIVCRSCFDYCDVRAIHFRLISGAVAIPDIDAGRCTGCGACLFACPVNAVSIKNASPEMLTV